MIETDERSYWEYRGSLSYAYKGETFYTVTPIPYYYQRRTILLGLLAPIIAENAITHICDFGCGDGWYLRYFADRYPDKHWYGVDISTSMIERARRACPLAVLQKSSTGIPFAQDFDLIYAIAVFAHISDDKTIASLFTDIYRKLKPSGRFLLFEATGFEHRAGPTSCRRTTQEYLTYATKHGFIVEQHHLIAFPFHRFFETRIVPRYCKLFVRGKNPYERCIGANRQFFYRFLSSFMCRFTVSPVRNDVGKQDGNTFYVLKK